MADSHDGNPVVTVIVLVVVSLAAAGTFIELKHQSSVPAASGAAGLGADATANKVNSR